MSSIPLPALHVTPYQPQQESPLDMYAKFMQIKGMQGQQQMQQQQIQGGQLDLQQKQLEQQSQQAIMKAYQDAGGDLTKAVPLAAQYKALPKDVVNLQNAAYLQRMNAYNELKTKGEVAVQQSDLAQGIHDQISKLPPELRQQGWTQGLQKLQAAGVDTSNSPQQYPGDQAFSMIGLALRSHSKLLEDAKTQAETDQANQRANLDKMEAAQKGSPLTAMETNPAEMAGDKLPAAMAYLKSKIADPNADPKDVVRATRLLSTAKTAQSIQLQMDASKKATDQAIQDGDPNAAGQLLVSGMVAPSQLISSRKPEFAQKAFSAAQKLNPTWNAQKADADFKVASSPQNVAFFGSAKSLTDKGGTLDQLNDAAKDIPGGKIPVFNKVADVMQAATGSGPVAKYAAILLGVADDYSKVMGGGNGSDTSRTQALQLAPTSASPAARSAAIEGIRGSVNSQANSRIGNNAVLQRMYGTAAPQGGPQAGYVRIRASDGNFHDIPQQNLGLARQRDPNLKVVQ